MMDSVELDLNLKASLAIQIHWLSSPSDDDCFTNYVKQETITEFEAYVLNYVLSNSEPCWQEVN